MFSDELSAHDIQKHLATSSEPCVFIGRDISRDQKEHQQAFISRLLDLFKTIFAEPKTI